MNATDDTEDLAAMIERLDEIEQVIVYAYIRRAADEGGPTDEHAAWLYDLIDRHRSGKPVYLSDLGM
jgi:gamma-glutamylcyclotransferase (GGCT)/AIG2-like uncharacterized protein YtfP